MMAREYRLNQYYPAAMSSSIEDNRSKKLSNFIGSCRYRMQVVALPLHRELDGESLHSIFFVVNTFLSVFYFNSSIIQDVDQIVLIGKMPRRSRGFLLSNDCSEHSLKNSYTLILHHKINQCFTQ